MSDLIKPPNTDKNPVRAIAALKEWLWEVWKSVDAALDDTVSTLTPVYPITMDLDEKLIGLSSGDMVVGNTFIWNGTNFVPGGNQWFSARSETSQITTASFVTIASWGEADIIETDTFTFNNSTGELTFKKACSLLVSAAVSAKANSAAANQLEIRGEFYTGGDSGSWKTYAGAEGFGQSSNGTQDTAQAIMPEIGFNALAGDKFRLAMRHVGVAATVESCVITAKRRY